nr:DEAD/DEAH box helicase family protein [Chitinophaga sedimenti]
MTNNINNSTELYPYQERDLNTLFDQLTQAARGSKILYQLPTGGGKTRIFSEIAKWYLTHQQQKVVVLTHRVELSRQTSATLKKMGINTKIINSAVKRLSARTTYDCYVAMVETLRNRIKKSCSIPRI